MAHRNSAQRYPLRRRRFIAGGAALWLAAACLLWTERHSVARLMALMSSHRWLLGGVLGILASSMVLRRRAVLEKHRSHDWLAALPVTRAIERSENFFFQSLPMVRFLSALWIVLCTADVAAAASEMSPAAPFATLWAATVGTLLGGLVGMVMPLQKPEVLPPGSRYVPHRKTGAKAIVPSTKALGIWPIRQMFASARPRTVSRASVFILLGLPLGSSADVAMLVIGLCALLALLSLLTVGVATVTKAASIWLAPLPLTRSAVARSLLLPSVLFATAAALLESWLLWLLQMDPSRTTAYALLTWFCVLVLGGIGFVRARSFA